MWSTLAPRVVRALRQRLANAHRVDRDDRQFWRDMPTKAGGMIFEQVYAGEAKVFQEGIEVGRLWLERELGLLDMRTIEDVINQRQKNESIQS